MDKSNAPNTSLPPGKWAEFNRKVAEEITPEMIQEGVRVFLSNLHDRVPPDWVLAPFMVAEVYLAMSRQRSLDSPSPTTCAQPGLSRDEP